MATDNRSAPLSFRASEEVKQRFQALAEAEPELKANDILEKLLNAYELAKQEHTMPEYEKDFADFAAHLDSLNTKFHNAIQMIGNAEQVAASKFARDLEERKAAIEALTEQVNYLKQEKATFLEEKDNLRKSELEAQARKEAAENTAKELMADKEDLRKQVEGLNSQIDDYKKKEQDLSQINSDLQLKLKDSEGYLEKINSLSNELNEQKHQVNLKDVELKNSADKYLSLKEEFNKSIQHTESLNNSLNELRKELDAAKEESSRLNSQLQAKSATLDSINSQLELERNRNTDLQSKYFSLVESVNNKTE